MSEIQDLKEEIKKLKKEKDFVILAHYYVDGEIQEIADYVGDSFYLAKVAVKIESENVLFAGVNFMGESVKLLNPQKHIYMADPSADCPMAHMVNKEDILRVRKEKKDVAVVCYVNSTAEIKALSDVCVTSSNALSVVKKLKEKFIFFIPDNNLARFIAEKCPEKEFIFNDGFCPVHKAMTVQQIKEAKQLHPEAKVLAHPECTEDSLSQADFIGSTAQIIDYATKSSEKEFIIVTENGILYELRQKNPGKEFYEVNAHQVCDDMKKVTLFKIRDVMKSAANDKVPVKEDGESALSGGGVLKGKSASDGRAAIEVVLPDEIMDKANLPLKKMMELGE